MSSPKNTVESNGRKASPNQMKGVFSLREVNIDWLRHQTLIEPSQANPESSTKHLRALVLYLYRVSEEDLAYLGAFEHPRQVCPLSTLVLRKLEPFLGEPEHVTFLTGLLDVVFQLLCLLLSSSSSQAQQQRSVVLFVLARKELRDRHSCHS
jgi:hypothetical protein